MKNLISTIADDNRKEGFSPAEVIACCVLGPATLMAAITIAAIIG